MTTSANMHLLEIRIRVAKDMHKSTIDALKPFAKVAMRIVGVVGALKFLPPYINELLNNFSLNPYLKCFLSNTTLQYSSYCVQNSTDYSVDKVGDLIKKSVDPCVDS